MKKTDDSRQRDMYRLNNKWEQSGLTQKAFCKVEEISFYNFKYWRHRINHESRMKHRAQVHPENMLSDFVPLELGSPSIDYSGWQLRFPNDIILTCPKGTKFDQLIHLIKFF